MELKGQFDAHLRATARLYGIDKWASGNGSASKYSVLPFYDGDEMLSHSSTSQVRRKARKSQHFSISNCKSKGHTQAKKLKPGIMFVQENRKDGASDDAPKILTRLVPQTACRQRRIPLGSRETRSPVRLPRMKKSECFMLLTVERIAAEKAVRAAGAANAASTYGTL